MAENDVNEASAAEQAALETGGNYDTLGEWSQAWMDAKLPDWLDHPLLVLGIHLGAIVLACLLALLITRKLVLPAVAKVVKRSRFEWDDVLVASAVFRRLSNIVPAFVVYIGAQSLLSAWPILEVVIARVALATMVVWGLMSFTALLNTVNALYERRPMSKNRPIKGYLSLIKIVVTIIGAIVILSIIIDRSPGLLLTGLGAMTAVLLLIFKDTILSVVASVTLGSNDMVRRGDWISVPSAGADGDVIDIALHHVTVQNFDKTIVTIPTYKLMADSFTNWRGMQQAGGRRIKRAVTIDLSTIGFLDQDQLDRFAKFLLLKDYIREKQEVLERYNAEYCPDPDFTANARRLTNIGTFRAYVVNYLRGLDSLHQEGMTFMVRQLQPSEHGLPIEIYVFTKTTAWGEFEAIQSDIFDHVLAIVPEFGLRVFQNPSGGDISRGIELLLGAREKQGQEQGQEQENARER